MVWLSLLGLVLKLITTVVVLRCGPSRGLCPHEWACCFVRDALCRFAIQSEGPQRMWDFDGGIEADAPRFICYILLCPKKWFKAAVCLDHLFIFVRFTFYLYECFVWMCVCMPHVCSACGGQKRAWNPLELVVMSHSACGDQAQVLCESSKCSQPLSHLFSPWKFFGKQFLLSFLKLH